MNEQEQKSTVPQSVEIQEPLESNHNDKETTKPTLDPDSPEKVVVNVNDVKEEVEQVTDAKENVKETALSDKIGETNSTLDLSKMSKKEKIDHILRLKQDISTLVGNVRNIQRLCEKHKNDNVYLQDYIGTLLKGN